AAWVASVANIDWPSRPGLPAESVRMEMNLILDKLQDLNMNAVIVQVRPSADALYNSTLEPSSYYLTGKQGASLDYDPLPDAIKEAHRRGIEFHVWLNPYRAYHPNQKGGFAFNHFTQLHPEAVHKYGQYYWMDPGSKAVQDHTFKVFMDLVDRYDIDGIHIDDYFYPYPEGGQDFPDDSTYTTYRSQGGMLGRPDWRRKNVDDFIHRVYDGVKEHKRWVKFGISPFGIWKPGYPAQITGMSQYDNIYADARKWLQEGWCDYFTPQLYWQINKPEQSFPVLLDWWRAQNDLSRHIWPGLYTSKVGTDGDWSAAEIVNQVNIAQQGPGTHGTAHFSMKTLMYNNKGLSDALKLGPYRSKVLMPESPWLSSDRPAKPKLVSSNVQSRDGTRYWVVKVKNGGKTKVRFYVVSQHSLDGDVPLLVSDAPGFMWRMDETVPEHLSVTAVDLFSNTSEPLDVGKP
ncbi:MAG: family 10 glycosylhydrolase, partial [bacterium]